MSNSLAYLLVFHGSTDPRSAIAAQRLAVLFSERIVNCDRLPLKQKSLDALLRGESPAIATQALKPLVEVGALESGVVPLDQQIVRLGQHLEAISGSTGQRVIKLVPLFLLAGVHVAEDIPEMVALAQAKLGDAVQIEVMAHLGAVPRLRRVLTERMSPIAAEAWVLLAHGSRRVGANQQVEALADHLGAIAAYWSTPPSLETQLKALIQAGFRKIGVLPYFLFPGGITDAIAQQLETFSQQFPGIQLHQAALLNATPEIADLIVDQVTAV